MKKTLNSQSGFTLIELVLVITILGILAIAAAPSFIDITADAQQSQRDGVAGAVREGINLQYANTLVSTGTGSYPATLDGAADGACTSANACYGSVIKDVVTSAWTKAGLTYTHDVTGSVFTYDPANGSFDCVGC
jgi:prepilin-type N-terminal cleavage/methylation domain-containing protein